MSEHARRLKFPLRVGTADNPNDTITVLEADGSWKGDPEKLVMWLLLREMQRGQPSPAATTSLATDVGPPSG